MARIKIKGMDKVLKNLAREIKKIKGRSQAGLLEAGLKVKADAVKQTPVKTGNLHNSAYVLSHNSVPSPGGSFIGPEAARMEAEHTSEKEFALSTISNIKDPVVVIGYTSYYAPFVHEMNKNYTEGNWKFLENSLVSNHKQILDIIAKRAKI